MVLFANLKAEMAKRGLKTVDIANTLGVTRETAYGKLNGRTEFTLKETIILRDTYFPEMQVDELFKTGQEVM